MLSSTSIEAARKQLKTKFKVDSKVIVKIPNPLPKYLSEFNYNWFYNALKFDGKVVTLANVENAYFSPSDEIFYLSVYESGYGIPINWLIPINDIFYPGSKFKIQVPAVIPDWVALVKPSKLVDKNWIDVAQENNGKVVTVKKFPWQRRNLDESLQTRPFATLKETNYGIPVEWLIENKEEREMNNSLSEKQFVRDAQFRFKFPHPLPDYMTHEDFKEWVKYLRTIDGNRVSLNGSPKDNNWWSNVPPHLKFVELKCLHGWNVNIDWLIPIDDLESIKSDVSIMLKKAETLQEQTIQTLHLELKDLRSKNNELLNVKCDLTNRLNQATSVNSILEDNLKILRAALARTEQTRKDLEGQLLLTQSHVSLLENKLPKNSRRQNVFQNISELATIGVVASSAVLYGICCGLFETFCSPIKKMSTFAAKPFVYIGQGLQSEWHRTSIDDMIIIGVESFVVSGCLLAICSANYIDETKAMEASASLSNQPVIIRTNPKTSPIFVNFEQKKIETPKQFK